jgi:hypothetical protein
MTHLEGSGFDLWSDHCANILFTDWKFYLYQSSGMWRSSFPLLGLEVILSCGSPLLYCYLHLRNRIWPLPRWVEARKVEQAIPGGTRNQPTNHRINQLCLISCYCWNLSSTILQNVKTSHPNMLLIGFVWFAKRWWIADDGNDLQRDV